MEEQIIVSKAKEYATALFSGNSGGHDISHTLRVYKNATDIAKKEPGCDTFIVAISALLHDVDDHKLFDTEDNGNARAFLYDSGIPKDVADRICDVINSVSFSRNKGKRPSTLEGEIVQDADRLDAIGAIGIARTFAYGGEHGRSIEDSVLHFHEKLLLLKDMMNTETAKELAQKRHSFMLEYLRNLREETG